MRGKPFVNRFSPFLLVLLASTAGSGLSAQDISLQGSAGFGVEDSHWYPTRQVQGDGLGFHGICTVQTGATYALAPDHKARFLFSALLGQLCNQQVSLDYQFSVFHRNTRDLYCFLGPSVSFISGDYTFQTTVQNGWEHQDRRYVDQRWRPGIKVGAGFQWTKNWAVELDGHLISMRTTGFQSVPDSTTWYAAILMSYRIPLR